MESAEKKMFTAGDWLAAKVKFGVPDETIEAVLAERGAEPCTPYADCERDALRLAYADILRWMVLGPGKVNNDTDSDNGWSHTSGGYDMSDGDRAELKAEANAIYRELEPGSVLKNRPTFRMRTHGVKRANLAAWADWD